MEKNMAEEKFLIENYGKKGTFASFLPGISGEKGIPIWCYYVNRGQCVVSFGVDNKDHSIMEFYPAHQAYQNVKTTGFRTFVKKDGKVTELFADENRTHRMEIARNGLKIEEENDVLGVNAKVDYFTLPGEKIGALVRRVTCSAALLACCNALRWFCGCETCHVCALNSACAKAASAGAKLASLVACSCAFKL